MDSAAYGMLGALLGAAGALTTVFLTHHFTQRRDEAKYFRDKEQERIHWLRDQKQACYHNAVKFLIRVRSIGALVKNTDTIQLPLDAPVTWYDDIAEANTWLSSLHYYCGEDYFDEIGEISCEFMNLSNWLIGFRPTGTLSGTRFLHILSIDGLLDYQEFVEAMNQIENSVANCARREFQLGPRQNGQLTENGEI